MKISKRFKNQKEEEWKLTIEMKDTLLGENIFWTFSLSKREKGKRKWVDITPDELNITNKYSAKELAEKKNRYIMRMVPEEWWRETFSGLIEKMRENFKFNLNYLYYKKI